MSPCSPRSRWTVLHERHRRRDGIELPPCATGPHGVPHGFILASIIETGHIRSADLSGPLSTDPEYVRIAKAATVVAVDELTAIYKSKRPSVVHIQLTDARVLTACVDFCTGDLENAASSNEVVSKFTELTSHAVRR